MMPRTKYCCLLPKSGGRTGEGAGKEGSHDQRRRGDPAHPDDTQLSISPSDCDDDELIDNDRRSRASNKNNKGGNSSSNRSYQTGDSDFQAVEWMRQRSAESSASNLHVLSERAQQEWTLRGRAQNDKSRALSSTASTARAANSKRQAREESIEVDDLSLFGIRILDRNSGSGSGGATATASNSSTATGSGSGMSFDPWRNSFLVDPTASSSASSPGSPWFPAPPPPKQEEQSLSPSNSQRNGKARAAIHQPSQTSSPRQPSHRGGSGGGGDAEANTSLLSDAEDELDAIIESVSSKSVATRRGANGSRRGTGEADKSYSSPAGQGRGLRTKEYRTATSEPEASADFDAHETPSRWSPRRTSAAAASSAIAAVDSEGRSPKKSPNGSGAVPRRYVMEALPRRSVSPRASPRSSPRSTASPRSSPEAGRRRPSSRSASPQRRLQDLRALDPILPDALAADEALSNVPSDVDQATKQRYLRACRLLKSALIERDTSLLPQERAFLNRLLEEQGGNRTGPVDLDEQASAIETASFTLLSDPLFAVESVNSSTFAEFENVEGKRLDRRNHASRTAVVQSQNNDGGTHRSSQTNPPGTPPLVVVDERHDDKDAKETAKAKAAAVAVARFDGKDYPFYILGVTPDFKVGALTPTLMESLRGFFPNGASEENFFLKFSLQRDGPSLPTLLSRVRTSKHTVVAVETTDGYVFGAYCSSPWRTQAGWFGSDDSFLWRLKHPRFHERSTSRSFDHDSEIEVYPVFRNTRIQYCTSQTLAVGGGEWGKDSSGLCPYPSEPTGIGFMIDGDLMGGETNSCSTFCNPRLGQRLSSKGGNEFDIRCLEVWTVTPAITIEEAENLEMHRHFVTESVPGS